MSRRVYIFAGGGTGGHLYPGLAVADELRRRNPDSLVVFACSDRPGDEKILNSLDYPYMVQPVKPFTNAKNPFKMPGFLHAWRASNAIAQRLIKDLKPAAVLGLGGFAAGPVVNVASRCGIASAMLNPDAIPGKANKYLACRADRIFTQFEQTGSYLKPQVRDNVRVVGCPIRASITGADRDEARGYFGLCPQRQTLLVFGGSTLAHSLTDAVVALADDLTELSQSLQLLIVAGDRTEYALEAFKNRKINVRVLAYCDRMDFAYASADLALTRGGAGTIAELTATSTPAVIMPYPHHSDRQQYHNGREIVAAGAARIVDDCNDSAGNAQRLRETLLGILTDPAVLRQMQASADSLPENHAGEAVADWLEKAAKQQLKQSCRNCR